MYSSNPNFIIKIPWSVSKSLPVILNTNCLLLLASWEEIQWGIAEIFSEACHRKDFEDMSKQRPTKPTLSLFLKFISVSTDCSLGQMID